MEHNIHILSYDYISNIYINIYIYVNVFICVCTCLRERSASKLESIELMFSDLMSKSKRCTVET